MRNITQKGDSMKRIILIAIIISFAAPAIAGYVSGYYRSDGTYVQGHYRSDADSSKLNNYSTQGNYNPYTGKEGTQDPFKPDTNTYNNNYPQTNIYGTQQKKYRGY